MRRSTPVVLVAALLVAAGCSGDVAGIGDPVPPGAVRLADDQVAVLVESTYSGLAEARREVIRDEAAWIAVWNRIHEHMFPRPAAPPVDFATTVVVVAAMGTRPSGGYGIRIGGVHLHDDGLWVEVRSVRPGPHCFVTGALTSPVTAVAVPIPDRVVRYAESESVTDCPP